MLSHSFLNPFSKCIVFLFLTYVPGWSVSTLSGMLKTPVPRSFLAATLTTYVAPGIKSVIWTSLTSGSAVLFHIMLSELSLYTSTQ